MASNETATPGLRKTCFVVMGFGRKTDFETGRTLDLDKTYKNVIKPAVTNAGLACIRADEIVHSGPLDMQRYDQLLKADIVIVDISTLNSSALYELGVRHALRPHGTIVIAEDGMRTFPFDINHILVRQYHHLGHGLDYDEVERFRKELAYTIKELLSRQIVDSPVYMSLEKLQPPTLGEDTAQAMAAARPIAAPEGEGSAQVPVTPPAPEPSPQSKAPFCSLSSWSMPLPTVYSPTQDTS